MLDDLIRQIAREAATDQVAHLESRIRFLEERLSNLQRQPELLTEKEAAALLRVHVVTMKRWRRGTPLIRFVDYPGSGIRYHRTDIENFIQRYERGKRAALKAA
jgi:Helix-turn-helix domain